MAYEHHVQVGKKVLVWTRGYHWAGKLVFVSAIEIVLDKGATMFVEIGQIDSASKGQFSSEAKGRQVDGYTSIPRLACEITSYVGKLPTKPIG